MAAVLFASAALVEIGFFLAAVVGQEAHVREFDTSARSDPRPTDPVGEQFGRQRANRSGSNGRGRAGSLR
jgi:hypothetical protein